MQGHYFFRRGIILLLLGALSGWIADRCGRRAGELNRLRLVQRPTSVQTRDDAALLSGWLDQLENSWEVGKNHARVRAAFQDVIADARKSTVRILSDGHQIALGTIVDADGYILTKASEIEARLPLICQFHDRRKRKAELVGTLVEHDLAMLKVDADRLVPVQWCTDEEPTVGCLLATPNLGTEPLAIGVVSVDKHPIAKDGVLGVRLQNAPEGPRVTDVVPHTAAAEAGLQHGDVVLRVDERVVSTSEELVHVINDRLPGETLQLRVRRAEDEKTLEVTLGRRAELDMENGDFQSFLGGELSFRRSGFPSVLQHDTFLLPSHCGGPLVDLDGRVVGINIARAERIASYALPAAAIVPHLATLKSGKLNGKSLVASQPTSTSRQERSR